MVNTKAIKKRMIDMDITYKDLADALGKAVVTVRQKITNNRPMFLSEAEIFQKVLDIPDDMFRFYFFHHESRSATGDEK